MRTLKFTACATLTLTLLLAGGAAFAQSAPATTAASAAPTTAPAPLATTSAAAPTTAPAPLDTAASEAPTTGAAAATTAPPPAPSWTPVQQLAATTTPPATGASSAGTTPPATAPAAAATAPLPSGPPTAANGHVLNFNDAPIDLVLKYLAESLGLQVVKQSPMTDVRVTIIGQQPIYVDDTVALLNSALNVKGYAAVRSGADGRILKIVSSDEAKKLNVPVHKGTDPRLIPTTDEIVTQVMPLRYVDATKLRQDLTPLVSPSASISSNASGNALIVTDTSANVHRIAEIVWALDTQMSAAAEVRIYQLQHADATASAKLITDLFKPDTTAAGPGGFARNMARFVTMMGRRGGGGGGATDEGGGWQPPSVKASADVLTNTLVVTGPAESLLVIDNIIKTLESNPNGDQSVFLYALQNGTAADMAPVLNNLFGTTAQGGNQRTSTAGNTRSMATASSSPQPGAGLLGQVYVVANTDTNALLVMTLPKYFPTVKEMIKQLDRPIPQVLIRVLIAEVTHDDTVDLGADFSLLNLSGASSRGTSPAIQPGGQLFTNIGELPNPSAGGLVFTTLNKDFSATIRALQTIGKLDVLSRPYILASDNQKANFQDVVQYPFASGSRVDVNGNVDTTVTWQTLGISLNVTPHINPDGIVTMLINPEIDTLTGQIVQIQAPSTTSPGLSEQVWGKRIATSQVAVHNGQTIVIGGMIQDQKTDTINKVPFLGDIPLIGKVFQHTVTAKTKTEVLIFLTPMVAMSPQELKALSKVEEEGAGDDLHNAVAPGTFQTHLNAMREQVPQGATPPTPPTQAPQTPALPTQPPQTGSPQTPAPETPLPQTQAPQTQSSETQPPQTQTPETPGG